MINITSETYSRVLAMLENSNKAVRSKTVSDWTT